MDHDTFGMEEKGSTTPDSSSGANGYTDGSARKKIKISRAKIACLPVCRSHFSTFTFFVFFVLMKDGD